MAGQDARIPRLLHPLLHAPEVHLELGLRRDPLAKLEAFLRRQDPDWLRLLHTPGPELQSVLDHCGEESITFIQDTLGEPAVDRLFQLELQAQGPRSLLRTELLEHLEVPFEASARLRTLFQATDDLAARITKGGRLPTPSEVEALARLRTNERPMTDRILGPDLVRRWTGLLGPIRNVATFQRVHPCAPDRFEPGRWLDGVDRSLLEFRGQVVLLHFYSFGNRACLANFPACNRWHQDLHPRGLRIIGIHNPESEPERDPTAVAFAAARDHFRFPVLADADRRNRDLFGTRSSPTLLLIDRRGYVRNWWIGELNTRTARGEQQFEQRIRALLAEPAEG